MQSAAAEYNESTRLLDAQERTVLFRVQRLFAFLKPLAIFLPFRVERGSNPGPLKGRKWDWNMTLLAMAYAFTVSIMVWLFLALYYFCLTTESRDL